MRAMDKRHISQAINPPRAQDYITGGKDAEDDIYYVPNDDREERKEWRIHKFPQVVRNSTQLALHPNRETQLTFNSLANLAFPSRDESVIHS